jgi:tripartite-type tricarboxylate transporter receptor subunit TctC
MKSSVLFLVIVAAGAALAALASAAHAQTWPSRPARIVVPFAPGGGSDLQARLFAKKFTESMGQSFVVENRGGAGGMVGAELVAKAPPDGYTILFMSAALSVNTTLTKLAFNPLKDLAPVSRVSSVPLILVVHPSVPAKNVAELVALAKRHKGKLNAASNGSGTTSHLAIEMLKQQAGIDAVHIPYKGGGAAVIAMMAGEVDFRFTTAIAALQHIRSGRVRAIAVASTKPFPVLPELPTLASVYPGFEADNWYAIFVSGGTPKDVIARLNGETLKALASADLRDAITKDGGEPAGSSPEELAAYFKREVDKYAKVIRAANIQPE